MIDRSGEWWRGSDASDLEEYLRDFTEEQYPINAFRLSSCLCGGRSFLVDADDNEGAARRTCLSCGNEHFIGDSAELWEEAEPERCACPCGSEEMNIGVGFAFYRESEDVKWMYIGCRCVKCGVLGCYADWKIGYGPSLHLLDQA